MSGSPITIVHAELQFVRVYFLGLARVFCHRQVKTVSQLHFISVMPRSRAS
jgi:hypothetical protein